MLSILLSSLLLLTSSAAFAQEPDSVHTFESEGLDIEITLLPEWTGKPNPIDCTTSGLSGPVTIHVFSPNTLELESGELGQFPTEIKRMELEGTANCPGFPSVPITLKESIHKDSPGGVFFTEEDGNGDPVISETHPANSFFDLFLVVDVDLSSVGMGTRTLFAKNPLRVEADITCFPPEADKGCFLIDNVFYVFKWLLVNVDDAGIRDACPNNCTKDSAQLFEPESMFTAQSYLNTTLVSHALLEGHPQHKPLIITTSPFRPVCVLRNINPGVGVEVIVASFSSGIKDIGCKTSNATASCNFTKGTKDEVVLTATKDDPNKRSSLVVNVTDMKGYGTICDPVLTTLTGAAPEGYSLTQNHPNPFSSNTSIRFQVGEQTHVQLTVYDMLGRKVATLVDETMPSGSYEVSWDGQNDESMPAASGVYFYRIEAGPFVDVRKMQLIR